jgi:NTE family protein
VVLSGGGARGAAHVGVLRVLEELHVPIDCISGTSMGAIVGGFYAAGWSPDEIEDVLFSLNWDEVLTGEPARLSRTFRRRQDDLRYLPLEWGIRGRRLAASRGMLKSRALEFELLTRLIDVITIRDFDQLAVPVRMVAADVVTADEVVLSGGNLSQAMRASMSLPGVFPPVEVNGRLLVDGGVVNNLPVDSVLDMGADVVIAVNVGTPLRSREELGSTIGIAVQALTLASERRIHEQEAKATVLIRPELGNLGTLDFSRIAEAIAKGKEAAHARAAELRKLAVADSPRPRREAPAKPQVRKLTVLGTPRVDARRVRAAVRHQTGAALDFDRLREDFGRIYEIGEFDRVDLDVIRDGSEVDLTIRPHDNAWGPLYLRAGLRLSDDLAGHNRFDLLFNLTRMSVNALGAEWRNEIQAGGTGRAATEFFQPLSFTRPLFAAASLEYRRDLSDIFENRRKIAEYDLATFTAGLDVGTFLGRYGEARIGFRYGKVDAKPTVGAPDFPVIDADLGGIRGAITVDRLSTTGLPTAGSLVQAEWFHAQSALGSDVEYDRVSATYHRFATRGRGTVMIGASAGTSFNGELPAYDAFALGGLLSLSGYRPGELRGQHFAVARAGYFHRVGALPSAMGTGIHAGGWLEGGNVWQERDEIGRDIIGTATAALAADTRFGAMYLAYGVASDGNGAFSLLLGQQF